MIPVGVEVIEDVVDDGSKVWTTWVTKTALELMVNLVPVNPEEDLWPEGNLPEVKVVVKSEVVKIGREDEERERVAAEVELELLLLTVGLESWEFEITWGWGNPETEFKEINEIESRK